MWKLDPKLKQFSLVGKVPAPGVINSLQLLTVAKGFIEGATWASELVHSDGLQTRQPKALAVAPFLLVTGVGQETRLGRWIKVKEGGAKNGTLVFLFSPRTTLVS
jgi:ribosomal RNA-processing protein 9